MLLLILAMTLRLQQVVHVGVAVLLVRRALGHDHHVHPQGRSFVRDRIGNVDAVLGFLGTGGGLHDVAVETDHRADVAVGQVADVLGGVEILNVRPDFQQRLLGFLVIGRLVAVGRQPQVIEGDRQELRRVVDDRHATLAELLNVVLVKKQFPGTGDIGVAEDRLDLLDVVTNTRGAPHVGITVLVARVVDLEFFISTGSRFFQPGSWLLSSFWMAPALISRDRKWFDGLTTSYPVLPVINFDSSTSLLSWMS